MESEKLSKIKKTESATTINESVDDCPNTHRDSTDFMTTTLTYYFNRNPRLALPFIYFNGMYYSSTDLQHMQTESSE